MELRQLRYFLSAVKHLSFTKAAEECCIVQSAMSQQIRLLEKELAVTLFERTKQGLRLTPEGAVVAREARKLLDQADAMQTAVRGASFRYNLRIGCQGNLQNVALSRSLAMMRSGSPEARAFVRTGMYQQLLDQLRDGRFDCLVMLCGQTVADADWLDFLPIAPESVCAMLPANSDLASQASVSLQALKGETLILYASELNNEALNAALLRAGANGGRLCAERLSDIEAMVAAGYGASFCVKSAARPNPGIVYRELTDLPRIQSCLAWCRGSQAEDSIRLLSSLLQMNASELISVF